MVNIMSNNLFYSLYILLQICQISISCEIVTISNDDFKCLNPLDLSAFRQKFPPTIYLISKYLDCHSIFGTSANPKNELFGFSAFTSPLGQSHDKVHIFYPSTEIFRHTSANMSMTSAYSFL